MLVRVQHVQGVGLFADAKGGKRHPLRRRSLIFGGNGRGKSTLASVLASCGAGGEQSLKERSTIDGIKPQRIVLQFAPNQNIEYINQTWNQLKPEIRVFDTDFINRNVHSGAEVTAEQRKNLLSFALGVRAVRAREAEGTATRAKTAATEKIRELTEKLAKLAGPSLTVPAFRALSKITEVEGEIDKLGRELQAARRAEQILQLQEPQEFLIPALDLEGIFLILNRTLSGLHEDAANLVEKHLHALGGSGPAEWVRTGLKLQKGSACPYCSQSTAGIELIRMYQVHFDEEYEHLRRAIDLAAGMAQTSTSDSVFDRFAEQRDRNNLQITLWQEYIPLEELETHRDDLAKITLGNVRVKVLNLFEKKALALVDEQVTQADQDEIKRSWQQFIGIIKDDNDVIESYQEQILTYKNALGAVRLSDLEQDLEKAKRSKIRHASEAETLIQSLIRAEAELLDAERDTSAAREALSRIMEATLGKYKDDINLHLENLGAGFKISELKPNYRGGAPRTEYQIELRGKPVKLTGGRPSFATALSEGDKRTMAFAFFVASTLADPDLDQKIIVVDDPMSSLDRSRRNYTIELLDEVSKKAKQTIVLAHDEVFLRELRNEWKKDTRGDDAIAELSVISVAGGYSDIGPVNLDELCESEYNANYSLVADFIDGIHNDNRETAQALRLLLEGYLHRKFPRLLPDGTTLGSAITEIERSEADSPLLAAKDGIVEMRKINKYASRFHHDTNQDTEGAYRAADPIEVATYGKRILKIIHSF